MLIFTEWVAELLAVSRLETSVRMAKSSGGKTDDIGILLPFSAGHCQASFVVSVKNETCNSIKKENSVEPPVGPTFLPCLKSKQLFQTNGSVHVFQPPSVNKLLHPFEEHHLSPDLKSEPEESGDVIAEWGVSRTEPVCLGIMEEGDASSLQSSQETSFCNTMKDSELFCHKSDFYFGDEPIPDCGTFEENSAYPQFVGGDSSDIKCSSTAGDGSSVSLSAEEMDDFAGGIIGSDPFFHDEVATEEEQLHLKNGLKNKNKKCVDKISSCESLVADDDARSSLIACEVPSREDPVSNPDHFGHFLAGLDAADSESKDSEIGDQPLSSVSRKALESSSSSEVSFDSSDSETTDVDVDGHANSQPGEKSFRCKECCMHFNRRDHLVIHLRKHSGEKPFKCPDCAMAFSRKDIMIKHQRIHSGVKSFKCTHCGKDFARKESLVVHVRKHSGETPFKCPDCNLGFSRKEALAAHVSKHTKEKPFKCHLCNMSFSHSNTLTNHIRKHTGEKPFKCPDCDMAFVRKDLMVVHRRKHTNEKPYKCSDCDMCFSLGSILANHRRTHSGEKPFKCSDCEKCFATQATLIQHTRTHTGEKPFQCFDCNKRFSRKSTLNYHVRTHTGERPHHCPDCDMSFAKKNALVVHRGTHTKEEPYNCPDCNKSFSAKNSLSYHRAMHSGEKPFKCSECNMSFAVKGTLKKHLKRHKGKRPFKCSRCTFWFESRNLLDIHMTTHLDST